MELLQGAGQGENLNWLRKVQREAFTYAVNSTKIFNEGIGRASKVMPVNNHKNRAELLNIMVDSMVGVLVSMGIAYCGDSLQFEEAVIQNIQHKFREMRKMKIMGKMNQPAQVAIDAQDDPT